ncbi:hypothetical protein KAR48_04950 [bacterium]|nr:hypothetical protein [bacterium]
MIQRVNFSDNIDVKSRQLHLQTHLSEDRKEYVHTLFDGGRVLRRISRTSPKGSLLNDIIEECKNFHQLHISEIEMLYQISVRIKTVRHAPSLLALGRSFLKWRLLDEALSELELAIIIDPNSTEILCSLSEAYRLRGGLKEAIDTILPSLKTKPVNADLWIKKGEIALDKKAWKTAHTSFKKAITNDPGRIECYLLYSVSFILAIDSCDDEEGKTLLFEKARESLNRGMYRASTRDVIAEKIVRALHKRNKAIALQSLEQWIEALPERQFEIRHDQFYLNYLYGENGRDSNVIDSYVKDLEKSISTNKDNAQWHNHLGIAYLLQCRQLIVKAIRQFEMAVKLDVKLKRAKRNLQLTKNDSRGFLILIRALLK